LLTKVDHGLVKEAQKKWYLIRALRENTVSHWSVPAS